MANQATRETRAEDADLQLARRAADGDERARRLLANRLVRRVARVARAMLQNAVDAEDASQVALIEILRSIHSYAGGGSLERWADRITARTVIRFARRERERSRTVAQTGGLGREAQGPQMSMELQLGAYLEPLSSARREVLVLRHVLEYSVREIAELIGAPEGTVKDRLVAARKQVRASILRDHEASLSGSEVR